VIGADDVRLAVQTTATAWSAGLQLDWSRPAGSLTWSCRATAEHLCDVLFSYAAQVAARPGSAYVRLALQAEDGVGPAELTEGVRATGEMLAAVVGSADPGSRAYHPSGMADPAGFAAMGITELLLHGDDVATGLGLDFPVPQELCGQVLARLFPDVEPATDLWLTLQWATGRADLPGRDRVTEWRWHGAPL
jgi:hypothetical protein